MHRLEEPGGSTAEHPAAHVELVVTARKYEDGPKAGCTKMLLTCRDVLRRPKISSVFML